MCLSASHTINGVSALHSEILKNDVFNDYYRIAPMRFTNVTNGITYRRWLSQANPLLSSYISKLIGDGFLKNADELKKLEQFMGDNETLKKWLEIKRENKVRLAKYIKDNNGIDVDPDSIFDVQVKRLHEYKRQLLNALNILDMYFRIKDNPDLDINKRTFIFGAKAAPSYYMAKQIIRLICSIGNLVNNDKDIKDKIKVVFLENYRVSLAEIVMHAADVSEQISVAGKEASGTGNMKFMLNGAVTLGTSDGANVEIHELVGDDNIYIFGEKSEAVIEHYEKADYVSKDYYKKSPVIKEAVDFIVSKEALKVGHKENLERLYKELLNKDWFMTLLDLEDYIKTKDQMMADYEDQRKWRKMMLVNIAKAGFFSSDRTIEEYNRDIWRLR